MSTAAPQLFEFKYHNPTRICFGTDSFAHLARLIPATARVLMLYGGGSIKADGVYERVRQALAQHVVVEFGGIESNPTVETLRRAVGVVCSHHLDFILAVSGGSVCDGAKLVAGRPVMMATRGISSLAATCRGRRCRSENG